MESDLHRCAKGQICGWLRSDGFEAEEERRFGPVTADVWARHPGGQELAIEVQASVIGAGEVYRRTQAYEAMGIAVLWMLLWNEAESGERRVLEVQRYLHAMYFGMVWTWRSGARARATIYRRVVRETREGQRTLKKTLAPRAFRDVDIMDMRSLARPRFKCWGGRVLPKALLWTAPGM